MRRHDPMKVPIPNTQPPEKVWRHPDGILDVVAVFPTVQGEGPFAGRPAVFVRLAGCDLQCPGCDTDYTTGRQIVNATELAREVEKANKIQNEMDYHRLVVVTGGEPFRQRLGPFVRELLHRGYEVQIETNGTLYDDDLPYASPYLSIVCSPKTKVHPEIRSKLKAWKYVLSHDAIDPTDGLPTSVLGNGIRPDRAAGDAASWIWVQPAEDPDEGVWKKNMKAAYVSAMTFGYRLGIQVHKVLGVD